MYKEYKRLLYTPLDLIKIQPDFVILPSLLVKGMQPKEVASLLTCGPRPTNFWFDHSTSRYKSCVLGVN